MIDDRESQRYGILLNINRQMPSSFPSTVALIVAGGFSPWNRFSSARFTGVAMTMA